MANRAETSDVRTLVYPDALEAPGYLADHAARVFNRHVDAALRSRGLSLPLIGPILLLSWQGSMLQCDLVRASAVKQPAMVALLDRLETLGLIVREPSTTDRRAAIVSLTEAGREAARFGGDALIQANERGLDGFSRKDRSLLVALLQRLIGNLARAEGTMHQS